MVVLRLALLALLAAPGLHGPPLSQEPATAAESPRRGGSLTVYVPARLPSLNYPLYTSTQVREVLYEIHETLLARDPETLALEPRLVTRWEVVDVLTYKDGREFIGHVSQMESGRWSCHLTWALAHFSVADEEVAHVDHGVVRAWLRKDVRWHDGHPLDADDVVFSHSIYGNPAVDCDRHRSFYQRIERVEKLDKHELRFAFTEPYFKAEDLLANLTILPRHLYDLRDPDHPRHDPDATYEECAREINQNPHNTAWVGLGPYRLVEHAPELVVARRFDGYFDRANGGWLDEIRWRHVPVDVNFQALLNGELDFSAWLSGDQYFGEETASERFQERFTKGIFYLDSVNYTPWNTRRALFADARVRRALAHAFDMEAYGREQAYGLVRHPTGIQAFEGPAYDPTVTPLEYDPELAAELLAEAGWYDRDGDGVVDRDGVPFRFEYLAVANHAGEAGFSQSLQEALARVGVKMDIVALEYATLDERLKNGDFDATGLAMTLAPETDPESVFHSRNADLRGSNRSGLKDAEVDRLIDAGRRELDAERRYGLWKALQRRVHELQPVLFRVTPARKYALRGDVRGFQALPLAPGYSIRRWWLAGER